MLANFFNALAVFMGLKKNAQWEKITDAEKSRTRIKKNTLNSKNMLDCLWKQLQHVDCVSIQEN